MPTKATAPQSNQPSKTSTKAARGLHSADFILSLTACLLALAGKWHSSELLVSWAGGALILAFLIVLIAAWQTVRAIK